MHHAAKHTEWIETVSAGWNTLVDLDIDATLAALERAPRASIHRSTATATPPSAAWLRSERSWKGRPTHIGRLSGAKRCPKIGAGPARTGAAPRIPAVMSGPTRVAVVGLGYWGPNLARNFASISGCELAWLCDPSGEALAKLASFPSARTTSDLEELLGDEQLDAVVLATPVPTHAKLATQVLNAGKHCFVEKPLATSAEDAQRAVDAASAAASS